MNREIAVSLANDIEETAPPPLAYANQHLRSILARTRVIAMVGASGDWKRPSYFAMKYLQKKVVHLFLFLKMLVLHVILHLGYKKI